MIITRTPYRVSFFGGGTDYPSWYREHGGQVLATSIDKYCYITCRFLPPFFEHSIRLAYSEIELCNTVDEIKHPSIRETLRNVGINSAIEIHHDGDMPARSGIGSSSSFTVGLLNALSSLNNENITKEDLLKRSLLIEQDILEETVGSQDQTMAVHGGFNHIKFGQEGKISVNKLAIPTENLSLLNSHLMLFFTGLTRMASSIALTYVNSLQKNEIRLKRMSSMVDEAINILQNSKNIDTFGELLHEGWMEKKSLGTEISTEAIDSIYNLAKSSGAIGGKLIGAGGGGFLLLFAKPEAHNDIRSSLKGLTEIPFKFEEQGSTIIFKDTKK